MRSLFTLSCLTLKPLRSKKYKSTFMTKTVIRQTTRLRLTYQTDQRAIKSIVLKSEREISKKCLTGCLKTWKTTSFIEFISVSSPQTLKHILELIVISNQNSSIVFTYTESPRFSLTLFQKIFYILKRITELTMIFLSKMILNQTKLLPIRCQKKVLSLWTG